MREVANTNIKYATTTFSNEQTDNDESSNKLIFEACRAGDAKTIRHLLKNGVNFNNAAITILIYTLHLESSDLLEILIENRFRINNDYEFLIYSSISRNQSHFIKKFIRKFYENGYERKILFRWACAVGDIEFINTLILTNTLSVNFTDLMIAHSYNQKDTINLLLNKVLSSRFERDGLIQHVIARDDPRMVDKLYSMSPDVYKIGTEILSSSLWHKKFRCAKRLLYKYNTNLIIEEDLFRAACLHKRFSIIRSMLKAKDNNNEILEIAYNATIKNEVFDYVNSLIDSSKYKIVRSYFIKDESVYAKLALYLLKAGLDFKDKEISLIICILTLGKYQSIKTFVDKYLKFSDYIHEALIVACTLEDKKAAKYIISAGGDINHDNSLCIRLACLHEHLGMIPFLIKNGSKVNLLFANETDNSKARVQIIKLLLKFGANIHENNDIALREACKLKDNDLINVIVKNGANPSVVDTDILVNSAIVTNDFVALKKLINQGVIFNEKQAIIRASGIRSERIVKFLINHTEFIKSILRDVIWQICRLASFSLIKVILKKGFTIQEIQYHALVYSLYLMNFNFVDKLISLGFDIHVNNDALIHDDILIGQPAIISYLLKRNLNIHAQNESALLKACSSGMINTVVYLIQEGADIHANDDEPLKRACAMKLGTYEIRNLDEDKYIGNPVVNEHFPIIKYLIDCGANVNADNEAALRTMCTAPNATTKHVKYLIDKGANPYKVKDELLKSLKISGNNSVYNYILNHTNQN